MGANESYNKYLNKIVGERYRLIRCIGEGGFGIVFQAEHIKLERSFALKLLFKHHLQNPAFIKRFEREAKATCKIGHENIIDITDFGEDDEFGYFGYLKKMMLTLHNIVVMKKGRMPLHGAMARIVLKNEKSANVIIIGDTGAGKSETLEGLRQLAGANLKEMTIIFDDMGSLGIKDGCKREIGKF